MILISIQLDVIDPDILSGWTLNSDGVNWRLRLANLQVANNDIVSIKDTEANTNKT